MNNMRHENLNNGNKLIGSLALLRAGCIFITIILLTRKQKDDTIKMFPGKQNNDF